MYEALDCLTCFSMYVDIASGFQAFDGVLFIGIENSKFTSGFG